MAVVDWRRWYRVASARVAQFLPSTETWDTSVSIPNLTGMQINPMMDNDQKRVFGTYEAMLSVITGYELTLDFTGKDVPSANVMTGRTSTDSGSGASATRKTNYRGGENAPYFGIVAQIEADDGGDVHILLPYGKLDSLMSLQLAEENQFAVPNVTAKFGRLRKSDGTLYNVMQELEHVSLTSIATDLATSFDDLIIV